MEPLSTVAILSLVKDALGAIRKARDLAQSSSDLELKLQISTLYDIVLQLKEETQNVGEENKRLMALLEQRGKTRRDATFGYIYVEGDDAPHCPACYEGEKHLLVHLAPESNGLRLCRVCNKSYRQGPMRQPPRATMPDW